MHTIVFSTEYLAAGLICAAKQDIRYYLKGIKIECANGVLRFISTDGHRLLRQDVPCASEVEFSTLMSRETAEAICETKSKTVTIELHDDHLNKWFAGEASGDWTPVSGRFPDYTRVIPEVASSEEYGAYNAKYIAVAVKIHKARGTKPVYASVRIRDNGPAAAIVELGILGTVYVVMPMRI